MEAFRVGRGAGLAREGTLEALGLGIVRINVDTVLDIAHIPQTDNIFQASVKHVYEPGDLSRGPQEGSSNGWIQPIFFLQTLQSCVSASFNLESIVLQKSSVQYVCIHIYHTDTKYAICTYTHIYVCMHTNPSIHLHIAL